MFVMMGKFQLRVKLTMVVIWLMVFLLVATTVSLTESSEAEDDENIAFDVPDLTTIMNTTSGSTYQLEAYKSINNVKLLQNLSASSERAKFALVTSQLLWVSMGDPMLCKTSSKQNINVLQLFHFTQRGFHTHVQMLTNDHIKELVSFAKTKYKFNVHVSQIVNLILSSFECSHKMWDERGKTYLVKGEVHNFRKFPLRLEFHAPQHSVERKLFEAELNNSEDAADLSFRCSVASRGKLMKTNTLKVSSHQIEVLGIEDKLFGGAGKHNDSVYVSRNQMTSLASEMYSDLNIIEDYEMPETQFTEEFVAELILRIALKSFSHVPIQDVMTAISAYGVDISGDLKADEIIRDMGEMFKVENHDSRKHIVVDESKRDAVEKMTEQSGSGSFGYGAFSASLAYADKKANSESHEAKSLNDQLNELNTATQDQVKWEIQGNKVVPKSLNVAKVSRAKLSSTLTFSRIQTRRFSASFSRSFSLDSMHWSESTVLAEIPSRLQNLERQLNRLQQQLIQTSNKTEEHAKMLKLVTPTLTYSLSGSSSVLAIALLNDQLFVSRHDVRHVSVYSTTTFQLQRQLTIPGLGSTVLGLATCANNNVLYLSDYYNNCVHKVDLSITNTNNVIKWNVASHPYGLSVNRARNVLVTYYSAKKVQEYTPSGSLVREISDSNYLWHAVELNSGMLAVSRYGSIHGVAMVTMDGHVIHSYGSYGSGVGQMNEPRSIAVDKDGYILVADQGNNRILIVNPMMTDSRLLPLPVNTSLRNPIALSLDQSRGRLYVGEYSGQYRMLVFEQIFNIGTLFG